MIQTASGATMNSGVSYESLEMIEMMENNGPADLGVSDFFQKPTGAEAPFKAMASTNSIVYILLPLLFFIGTADFTSGAAKNTLASGVSRGKYYASKLILSCVSCALLLLAYVLFSTLAATIISGFGGTLDGAFLSEVAKVFFSQLWLCLAIACVGNFFVFLMRSAAVIGVFIALLIGPSTLIMLLTFVDKWFMKLFDYELTMGVGALAKISSMPAGDITRTLLVGAGYLIAAVFGGLALFKKAEIK